MVLLLIFGLLDAQVLEPTRPVDIFNPFGAPTTRRPKNQALEHDEVVVRLPIGDLVGKSVLLRDLPWTPQQDITEQIPRDRMPMEPSPLPKNNNVTVYTFLGVPYAEAPVANRRFKPPQQLTHFPGQSPFFAIKYGPSCAQDVEQRPQPVVNDPYPHPVDEDCLYLNIFSPDVSKTSGMVYPVMVFFHGGNFQTGSATEWPGHIVASRGMVAVTVNYRLGAFGFMSLGDSSTGNLGLQDQKLALEWVRDHIASFGGDPQAVTIAGHDSGAVSVGLHMLSPFSKGLFRATIAMSGAEVSYHSTIGKPALAFNNTIKLGRYLGCSQAVATNVWDCINTRSTTDIVRASTTIPVEYNRYLFLPTVDGKFIPGNPLWILNNAPTGLSTVVSPVPLLVGMNAQDGSEVVLEDRYLGEFNNFNNVDQEFMRNFALEYSFRHNYSMNREAITEAMIDRYTYWPDPADEWRIREHFVQMTTDAYYTAPIGLSAHLHSAAGSRTYMYVNNYNMSKGTPEIPGWMGVCRECDLYLAFGIPFLPPELLPYSLRNFNFSSADRNASQILSNVFRRFVTYLDPNFLHDGTWSAFQPRRHYFLNFNYTPFSEISVPGTLLIDYRDEHVNFWNQHIPKLVNYFTTTFPPSEVSVRRQLVLSYWIVAVLILVVIILAVLSGSFAYQIFGRDPELKSEETKQFFDYGSTPSVDPHSCITTV